VSGSRPALVATLAWCAVAGWFAFVRDTRVPLLGLVDLGFHELGHLVMYVIPIHEILTAVMGSVFQCAIPLGLAVYFAWRRRDAVGTAVCLAWGATNFRDVAVYVADAPYERLELIGGEHDWAFLLGPDGFDALERAADLATLLRAVGLITLAAAVAVAVAALTMPPRPPATLDGLDGFDPPPRRVPIRALD
jgi:hypothetical protein